MRKIELKKAIPVGFTGEHVWPNDNLDLPFWLHCTNGLWHVRLDWFESHTKTILIGHGVSPVIVGE